MKCSASYTITEVNDGNNGRGITSVTYEYATAASQSVAPTTFSSSIPEFSGTNIYLWQKVTTTYTDGTSESVVSLSGKSIQGPTGPQGPAGNDGVSSWTPVLDDVVRSGSTFTKTKNTSAWDAQVYSREGFSEGCYVEAKPKQNNKAMMVGLNSDPRANADFASFDYALYFRSNGNIGIWESGVDHGNNFASYTTSSIGKIIYDGKDIRYYLDNTLLRTVSRTATTPLYLDSSFYNTGASVEISYGSYGAKGNQGDRGFSIVASVSREGKTEDWWSTYGCVGRTETWSPTASIRNGCRIGDLFTVVGTSTEGNAHTSTFRSTTASGNLTGTCISHVVSDKGNTGDTGEAAKQFILEATSQTFLKDLRRNDTQTIEISTQVSGYAGTPTITSGSGYLVNGNLVIPYNTAFDTITVSATLSGAPTQTLTLNAVDTTEYYLYKGVKNTNPVDVNLYGDHYFNSVTQKIMVFTTAWDDFQPDNLADYNLISLILSNCQSDVLSTIEEGTVTSSYYGYFNTIISNLIKTTDIEATNLKIDSSNIQGSISLDNIDGGGIKLTSGSISATDAGGNLKWQLNGDGSATFIDAEISGNLVAKSVTHDGLNTINEVATTPIGSSSSPYVFPKDCWQVDTNISAFRNNYLAGNVSYSGSSYRGYAVYNASFVYHPSSYTASSTLAVGNIISGSVNCNAGCSKDLFTRVKNEKAYPFWIKCNMSLGGNLNGIYTRIWGTNGIAVEDNEDKNSELIIFPNEYVNIHCHSDALWGEKTASGNISGRLSCGYNEATAPVLVFSDKTRENFGNDCTEELPYKTLGTYNLAIPCRYVLLNYIAQIQDKHSSYFLDYLYVDGNQASSIKKYSSTNSVIVDLGSKKTNFRVSWFTNTHTVHNDDGSTGISRVLSNFYRLAYVGMVEIDGNLVSASLALTLNDTNKTQYQFKPNGWINNHHEYVLTLFNRTASFTKVRGITAYNYIKNTLQLANTNYQLNIASMIALGGSGLVSGLTYMEVGPTSIIFHTADNTYTLTTVGDTATTLRSVFDSIQLYLQPISQPTGIETRDIVPKKVGTSRFNIGTDTNRYQFGFFDKIDANVNSEGTAKRVYGAVFN